MSVAAAVLLFAAGSALAQPPQPKTAAVSEIDHKHRSHLPLTNTVRQNLITYDAKSPDTKFPPIEQLRPPKGARE